MIQYSGLKLLTSAFLILCSIFVNNGWGQVSTYSFSSSTGSALNPAWSSTYTASSGDCDDGWISATNIGFNFVFNGSTYTQFSYNFNGGVRLGSTSIGTSTGGLNSSTRPVIGAGWDDVSAGYTTGNIGYIRHGISGSGTSEILVIDFFIRNNLDCAAPRNTRLQVRLYETTNIIEILFISTGASSPSNCWGSGEIGLGASSTNYLSVNSTNHTASNSVVTFNTPWPGNNKLYTFTPPAACNSASISFTSGSSPQTICPGGSITNMVYTYSGEATNALVTNLPAGLSSSVNTTNKTVTISGTPTASGTFTVTTTGHTCGNAASITGTVNSGFALPSIGGGPAAAWSSTGSGSSGAGISAANPFTPTTSHTNLSVAWPGDWIFISVTAGETYEFLTNSHSDAVTSFIYLTNQDGSSVYTSAEGILSWKATSNEIIRFYIQDSGCSRVEENRRRWVKKISSSSEEINYSGPWGPSDASPSTANVSYIYGNEYRHVSAADICSSSNGAIRFQKVDSWIEAAFDYVPCEVSFCYAYNSNPTNTLKIEESANGTTWTNLATPIVQAETSAVGENRTYNLLSTSRYVRWTQTAYSGSGNNRIDDIYIQKINTVSLSSASGTDDQTKCMNSALTNITYTTTGATGISNSGVSGANGLPAGVSASWSTNTITISGTPTESGEFNFSIPLTGGCGIVSATGTITVNSTPSAPTSVTPSATTICHGNSINLNAISAGNTINWYTVATDGTAIQTGVVSATNYSVSPTSNTTYYSEAQNGSGCKSSRTATGVITVENPVSAVNTAIGTTLQNNDYVWVGQTNSTWSTANNWRQYNGTNLVAAGSAPGSDNTNRIYVVQNSTSSNCIFNATSLSLGGTLGVSSLYVGTGTSLNLNNQNLDLSGNITINGTFTPGSGIITLSGNSNQTLDGSSSLSFSNVTINKSNGTLTAAQDMTITGNLTLTSGILDMNSKALTMGTASANGTITGGSASSYIVALDGATPSKLIHRVNSTSNATYLFPIGTGSKYTPVTLVMKGGTLSNAEIQVWTKNSKVTGMSDAMSCLLNRSWFVEPTGITNPTYDIQLGFASGDFSGDAGFDLNPVKLSSGVWYKPSGSLLQSGTIQGTTVATTYASPSMPTTSSGSVYWNGLTSFSEFGGAGGSAPLPVELVSFSGACEGGKVKLSWQTASEFNSSHFDIEKSRDGENWQLIETIPAAGNSNELINYETFNQVTNILNYYRLNQVDIDGTNKRYDPIAVSCEKVQSGVFMTYPNPSANAFKVLVDDEDLVGEIKMNIYSASGNLTMTKIVEVNEGINLFIIQEKLLSGLYLIEFKNQQNKIKVIKHLVN